MSEANRIVESKPKILVVWSKCDSESGYRVTKLVKYLVYQGYNVTYIVNTITSKISGANIIQIEPFPNPAGALRRIGLHNFAKKLDTILYIPDPNVLFSLNVFRFLRCSSSDYDVIITSSPFEAMHLVGLWCKSSMGIPWIADFRDMWTQDGYRYKPVTVLHDILCRRLEKKIYSEATCVITVTPAFGEMVKDIYRVRESKFFVITNGYDPDDFEFMPRKINKSFSEELQLGFNGIFEKGEKLPTRKVLQGIKWANKNGANIKLHLYGEQSHKLNELIKETGNKEHVEFHGHKPHRVALKSVARHDALLVCLEDLSYTDKIATLKLYEYLMIPLPIIGVVPVDGYAAQIINKSQTGVVYSPNENLGKKFLDFYYQWKAGKSFRKIANSKSTDFINSFSWKNLILKWAEVINQCTRP